jgi:methyltransferase (TIGR00027 family)
MDPERLSRMALEDEERPGDNFTNDSAMMIAYERALETESDTPLFCDPFARRLAGSKGAALSETFGAQAAVHFGFTAWPEFHKTWTVVRTRFIDDAIDGLVGPNCGLQFVNLGAGFDTRAFRLECLQHAVASFEVDMEVINSAKAQVFKSFGATKCPQHLVSADLLNRDSLGTELAASGFEKDKPTIFLAEGLIMYLPTKEEELLGVISSLASPGSALILNFMSMPTMDEAFLRTVLEREGWTKLRFNEFGDDVLDYGRFNRAFPSSKSFSFVTCRKEVP